jgi:hypothetical protein
MNKSIQPASYPMPQNNEFSADEEKDMRQGQRAARIAPAPTPEKIDRYMSEVEPNRISPDDATDEQ